MSAPAPRASSDANLPPRPAAPLPPPLKWAGGKRWMLPHLLPLVAAHRDRRLVEPFCGGLAVALALQPMRALLNDVNPHLINFYRQVQRGLRLRLEMRNEEQDYYRQRDRFNDFIRGGRAGAGAERAALFYYLNRTGFNGLCRFNSSGLHNVPFGRHGRINYTTDFRPYRALFRRWQFQRGDFSVLKLEPEDLLFADPPYDVEFTTYSAGGFSWADQVRTVEWLTAHRGPIVATNQATERIIALYTRHGFALRYLDAPRRIRCTGDRTPAREVLATRGL